MTSYSCHLQTLFQNLSDYTCFEARIHWFFCDRCGFIFTGEGEIRDVNLEGQDTKRVWTPKKEGSAGGSSSYLSVNAVTLDADHQGLDLREWTEKNRIAYLDIKDEFGEDKLGKPYPGGMYWLRQNTPIPEINQVCRMLICEHFVSMEFLFTLLAHEFNHFIINF